MASTERISASDLNPAKGFKFLNMRSVAGNRKDYWVVDVAWGDKSYQVHNRYGAFHVQIGDLMYEPERIFGSMPGRELKYALVQKISTVEKKIRDATGVDPVLKTKVKEKK